MEISVYHIFKRLIKNQKFKFSQNSPIITNSVLYTDVQALSMQSADSDKSGSASSVNDDSDTVVDGASSSYGVSSEVFFTKQHLLS